MNLLTIPQRARKFIGMLLLVPFVMIYALLAMVMAVKLLPGTSLMTQTAYYIAAGFLWIVPAALIVWFMQVGSRKSKIGNKLNSDFKFPVSDSSNTDALKSIPHIKRQA